MNARSDGQPKSLPRKLPYGIAYRNRRKPYIVKFKRNKRSVYVGSYKTLDEASIYANNFLLKELAR